MNRKRLSQIVILAVACLGISIGVVHGHHSYGDFHTDLKISVEGTLERIAFVNPHAILTVRTADSQVYTLEWTSITQLQSRGVKNSTLLSGQTIVATGSPKRSDDHYLARLEQVRRPADGWSWSRQ